MENTVLAVILAALFVSAFCDPELSNGSKNTKSNDSTFKKIYLVELDEFFNELQRPHEFAGSLVFFNGSSYILTAYNNIATKISTIANKTICYYDFDILNSSFEGMSVTLTNRTFPVVLAFENPNVET